MRKLHIFIHDKTRNKTTGELEDVKIEIKRDLYQKDDDEDEDKTFAKLSPNGGKHEHNILLYIENFGSKVTGTLEYVTSRDRENGTSSKINIGDFYLDL